VSTRWLIGVCSAHSSHRRQTHYLVGSALGCGLRSDPALVGRLWPDMGLSKTWRFTRGVSILAVAVVCVGAFLCLLPTSLDVSTVLTPAHSSPLDRGADQSYLAVTQEEEGEADKDPVNADLLMMLVLGVSALFGLSFGWVLTNTQRQRTMCFLGVVGPSVANGCEELPFLGVLRL
jgi:hypothetical protein